LFRSSPRRGSGRPTGRGCAPRFATNSCVARSLEATAPMHAERRGLPRIPPYPLPRDADLPPPRVAWRPARDRAALLIHDMQHYFVRAFAEGSPAIQTAIAHIDALRRHCAQAGIPVFYTVQPGRQDRRGRGLQADFWGEGMGAGADQVAIIDALS